MKIHVKDLDVREETGARLNKLFAGALLFRFLALAAGCTIMFVLPQIGHSYMLTVKSTINANGISSLVDAFDSSNPLYSTNGQYIASKATDGGGVATLSTNANALNFGSVHVYGPVAVPPQGNISTNFWYIGSHVWQTANPSSHIQSGWFTKDFYGSLSDVQAPTWTAVAPSAGTVNAVSYAYVLESGNYKTTSGNLKGKVYVTGNAVWYITQDAAVSFTFFDSITLATNASLTLYVGSPSASLPNLVNHTTATKFNYFGLPTNTNLNQRVLNDFIGTIYAPNANYIIGGDGTGRQQKIIGAIVVNSINFDDFFTFHYDEDLGRSGFGAPPPAITTQPENALVNAFDTASFYVTATGTRLLYQWARNQTNILNATNRVLTLTNVSQSDLWPIQFF
jgi:hypothetical protein